MTREEATKEAYRAIVEIMQNVTYYDDELLKHRLEKDMSPSISWTIEPDKIVVWLSFDYTDNLIFKVDITEDFILASECHDRPEELVGLLRRLADRIAAQHGISPTQQG